MTAPYFPLEMPVTFTRVSGWRCPWRLWYPVLFLNLWIRIFGPLVCSAISPDTATLASLAASVTRSSPSTRSTAASVTASPGSPASFSTSITSPSATLYCLPPVLTIAYIGRGLPETYAARSCWRMKLGPGRPGSGPQERGARTCASASVPDRRSASQTALGGPALAAVVLGAKADHEGR